MMQRTYSRAHNYEMESDGYSIYVEDSANEPIYLKERPKGRGKSHLSNRQRVRAEANAMKPDLEAIASRNQI